MSTSRSVVNLANVAIRTLKSMEFMTLWNYFWSLTVYIHVCTDQCTRFWYLSLQRAAKAQVILRICADSSEPLLLAYTKYG